MSTKIQLNSLEALERLIGGDNELEIEIRNSCVQEFAKKHLKNIGNDAISNITSLILRDVKAAAEERFGRIEGNGWGRFFVLRDEIKQSIHIRTEEYIKEVVATHIQSLDLNNLVERYVRINLGDAIKKILTQESIRDIIKKDIKNRLESVMKGLE